MHILTKVFVVLAAVLSLMLAAATMIYANNAETVRQAYLDAELERELISQQLEAQSNLHSREQATLMGELQARDQQLSEVREDMDTLRVENDRLRREKFEAESEVERVKGQIGQLGVASQTQATVISNYKDEVSELREAELQFRDERLELEDTIADYSSQIQVLEQTVGALEEQLAAAQQDLEALRAGGGVVREGEEPAGPVTISGPPIFGVVEAVREEPETGKTLVQVSLGSSDRMRENAKLLVFRNNEFVANVVLTKVDLQDALGEVVLRARGKQIREGDRVTTRLMP